MHVKGSRQEEWRDIIVSPFVTPHPKHHTGKMTSAVVIGTAIYTRHGKLWNFVMEREKMKEERGKL